MLYYEFNNYKLYDDLTVLPTDPRTRTGTTPFSDCPPDRVFIDEQMTVRGHRRHLERRRERLLE